MPNSKNYDLDIDTTLGGNNASDYVIPSQKAIKSYVDNHSGGGSSTDVQINGTSITSDGVANILTNTAYDASSNKIATVSDVSEVAPTLFEFHWFDHLINNQNWLRADTFSWHSGTTYSNPYNHLVSDISGITAETETIGSYTVTFYRATDGHKVCLANQEQTVLDIYAESGIAWYYILDTTNTRFKAPRTKFGFEGLRNTVGDKIDAGLPNITGYVDAIGHYGDAGGSGALHVTKQINNASMTGSNQWGGSTVSIDASNSNQIYGNSTTVQEPATQMYLYFYVGGFTQNATLQTAGLNSELFNGKADTNLLNLPNNLSTPFFDGQWVSSHLGINSNLNVGSYSYSLNSYLPNDNYTYEILCQIDIAYNSASASLWVGTVASPADNQTSAGNFYATGYVMTSSRHSHFQCILPIDTGRTLYTQVAVAKLAQADVNIMGYRRIGTNT